LKYFYLIILPILFSCAKKTHDIPLRNYFPSEEGRKYVYNYTNNNKNFGSTESVLIKVKIKDNPDVYCYVAPDEISSTNPTLASYHFLEGIFCFSGDTVKISPRFTLLEPDTASIYNQFQPFFKPFVNIKDEITIKFSQEIIYTYRISKYEKVKTPMGKFNCIKIDYTRYDLVPLNMRGNDFILYEGVNYPAFSKTASAWLAADIGMIKWERYTGRIDKLKSYSKK